MRVPKGEEIKGQKAYIKIITKSFQNLGRVIDIQTYEAQRTPSKIYPKKITLRHMIIKLSKSNIKGEF